MNIKESILTYVFNLIIDHQPTSLTGTYDGSEGDVVVEFLGDPETYTIPFQYNGVSVNEFREILCESAGLAVKEHNYNMGIPSRQGFIDSVTED
jgi:hypothetical protein